MCFSGHNLSFFPFFCLTLVNRNGANKMNALRKVIRFYVEGFREMTVGRTLWAVILVKLSIMFAVLKVFFSPTRSPARAPRRRPTACWKTLRPRSRERNPQPNNTPLCYPTTYQPSIGRVRNSP